MNKLFKFKLAGMRKEQEWIVYPRTSTTDPTQPLKVQSDKSIGIIRDEVTGRGLLNTKNAYTLANAVEFIFPPEFVKLAQENEYKKGDTLGGVCVIG